MSDERPPQIKIANEDLPRLAEGDACYTRTLVNGILVYGVISGKRRTDRG